MSIKKTLVAAAILAGVSGAAVAAEGDTARVDNIRWVYDMTIQNYDGNMIITDVNDKMITTGHEFDLATVSPEDLSFDYNYAAPAIMIAQNFADTDEDGEYDEGEELTHVPNATWVMNSAVANAVSGGVISPYTEGTLTFKIDGENGVTVEDSTIDGTNEAVNAGAVVNVYVKSSGDEELAKLNSISSVFVLGSITATETI